MNGGFLIEGEVAMQHAEIARLIACLGIQATTGMRHSRGSMIAQAAKWSGSPKRTAKGALEDLVVWYYEQGGVIGAQWGTATRALGDDRAAKLRRKCERIERQLKTAENVVKWFVKEEAP